MNKLLLAIILVCAVVTGYVLFTYASWVQEKATWTLTYVSKSFAPLYNGLAANPIVGPAVTGAISLVGAKLFYSNAMNQVKADSRTKENELTSNLIQTSGTASTLQSSNDVLVKELEQVNAELTALKASDPTSQYETLLEQKEAKINNLLGQIDSLQTALLNKETKTVPMTVYK